MKLEPKSPPGSAKRRARAYGSEIDRLRIEGYTIAVIRETLRDIGVTVGLSTVQREAALAKKKREGAVVSGATPETARRPGGAVSPPLGVVAASPAPARGMRTAPAGSAIVAAPVPSQALGDGLSGKDVAERFVQGQIGNTLARKRRHE